MADPGKPVAPGDVEKGGSMIYNSTEEKVPLVPPVDPQAKGKRKSNIILILAGLLVVAISTTIVFVVDATKSDDDDSDEMVEDLESDLEELENNKFFTESQLAFFGGLQLSPLPTRFPEEPFILALQKIDFEEVKKDISAMLVDSQDFWPADYGTYGAFFIHLAWHCSATYRTFDGRGGCEGGRPRFEPERSMGENVNKDKAWVLLKKIKDKYGRGLSWGDLIILTANVAIHDLGGPVLGFCAGRIDVKSSYRDHILTDRGLIPIVDQPGTLPQLDPQLLHQSASTPKAPTGPITPRTAPKRSASSSPSRASMTARRWLWWEEDIHSARPMGRALSDSDRCPMRTLPTLSKVNVAPESRRTFTPLASRVRGPRSRPSSTTSTL